MIDYDALRDALECVSKKTQTAIMASFPPFLRFKKP